MYGRHTGVDSNTVGLERPTVVEALAARGYETILAGKYLNSETCDTPSPMAFTHAMCVQAQPPGSYTLRNPDLFVDGQWTHFTGYTTDILADYVVANYGDGERPFFAMYTPPSPHRPADDDRCRRGRSRRGARRVSTPRPTTRRCSCSARRSRPGPSRRPTAATA